MKIPNLYIGKGENVEFGKKTANGFYKINSGPAKDTIFTYAFISRKDAEIFYGKGNYQKMAVKEDLKKYQKLQVPFTEADLQDLQHGKRFDWTFQTDKGESINVEVFNEDL